MICEPFVVPRVIENRRSRLMRSDDLEIGAVRSEIGDRLQGLSSYSVEERSDRCFQILTILLSLIDISEGYNTEHAPKMVYKGKTIFCLSHDTHNGELAREFNLQFPIFDKAIRL